MVCYDLRFPVWFRNKGDYDALDLRRELARAAQAGVEYACYARGRSRIRATLPR